MIKVLHIIPSLGKGGAERLVAELCNELTKQNLAEVLLVLMNDINKYADLTGNTQIISCSSRVVPSISGKAKVDISAFREIVNSFNPDVIHSHLFEAEMLSRWEIKPGVAYITHCHSNMQQLKKRSPQNLKSKIDITDSYERQLMIKRYRNCNNKFIAISKDNELFLKENLPIDLHKINLLNNAINVGRFLKTDSTKKKRINHDETRLINTGSFVDNKNQSFLIDVVAELHKQGFYVKLDLLGDGPNRNKIELKIKETRLSDYVFCHGVVNKVEEYLHKADIYVHSALSEAFGLSLIESMAAGLPVVCLDGKGNRDIIRENHNGFMMQKADVVLFAQKIVQLIRDKELYARMSENAEAFAKDFDIKNYVQRLREIYEGITA